MPYCHLLYNLGNYFMAVKDHSKALDMYHEAVRSSPFLQCGSFASDEKFDGMLSFNSRSCFAHTLSNLAVIYLLMSTGKASVQGDYTKCTVQAQKCIELALEAMPEGEGQEAYINMNNVMRQMGCKTQAFDYTWISVGKSFGANFEKPEPFKCDQELASTDCSTVCFVCVKYGTKYGADYVNKLYKGVRRFTTIPI